MDQRYTSCRDQTYPEVDWFLCRFSLLKNDLYTDIPSFGYFGPYSCSFE